MSDQVYAARFMCSRENEATFGIMFRHAKLALSHEMSYDGHAKPTDWLVRDLPGGRVVVAAGPDMAEVVAAVQDDLEAVLKRTFSVPRDPKTHPDRAADQAFSEHLAKRHRETIPGYAQVNPQ